MAISNITSQIYNPTPSLHHECSRSKPDRAHDTVTRQWEDKCDMIPETHEIVIL